MKLPASPTLPLIASLLLGLLLLSSCITGRTIQDIQDAPRPENSAHDDSSSREPIRIGAIFMLSGLGSNWGTYSLKGAELAIKEINSRGGVLGRPLQLVSEDNRGDNPAAAVSALHSLIGRGIKIVLGPNWSPSGIAVAPIACDQGVVMISPSLGVSDFNEKCDFLFNLWPHDSVLSEKLGGYLYGQGFRRVAIMGSTQVWEEVQARAVKKGFEDAGGKVVSFQLPPGDSIDFRTEILKIKETDAQAIMVQYSFEHLVAKQLREMGVDLPIFMVLVDDERVQGANGALEGAVAITSFTPTQEFSKRFFDALGENIDVGADTSYDAVMLLAEGMENTGSTDPSTLKGYLNSLASYSGASGNFTFDGKGGVNKPYRFLTVKGGKLILPVD